MQQELTALQPELIQTSAETDKMMVKIEGETVEVDAKKALVSADEKVANEAAAAAQAIKVLRSNDKLSSAKMNVKLLHVMCRSLCRKYIWFVAIYIFK